MAAKKSVIADDGRSVEPGWYQGKYYPDPARPSVLAEDGRFIESGRWYQGRYYPAPDEKEGR